MRTKTLLLTAALSAAGIATSMAQVYSQNAVGYINLSLSQGFNMIANQLVAPSYTLSSLIPNPPLGTQIYKFSPGSGFAVSTFDELDAVWLPNGNETLNLGRGVWINVPSAYTLTFVGEVPQGTLTTPTTTGFNMVASQVPQVGSVSTLGLVPGLGDVVYRYTPGSGFAVFTFDELDAVWLPSEPSLNVGEAVWLLRASGSPSSWVRTFNVN